MEFGVSLDEITNPPQYENQQTDANDAFHAEWRATDAAHLHPSNLSIGRVPRAWERKPLSPLMRRKIRVGKVWKRAVAPNLKHAGPSTADVPREMKQLKARSNFATPLKPVKKLRLDTDFGISARVSRWEERHSPARKIATSSTAPDILLELPEDEQETDHEDHGDVTVEILDEAGNIIEDGMAEDDSWCDLEDGEEGPDGQNEHESDFEESIMHLGVGTANTEPVPLEPASPTSAAMECENPQPRLSTDGIVDPRSSTVTRQTAQLQEGSPQAICMEKSLAARTDRSVGLPDGFVSPAKRKKFGLRSSKAVSLARRQTLPIQFAPNTMKKLQSVDTNENLQHSSIEKENDKTSQGRSDEPGSSMPFCTVAKVLVQEDLPTEESWTDQIETGDTEEPQLRTLDFEHSASSLLHNSYRVEEADTVPGRASSAPPEEDLQLLSPEKSFKPRLSDDTALLQAFLNRAAESKSTRRISVTAQESLSNRRDSDTVRQALASPAATKLADVLGELDPNSPSPRKPSADAAPTEMAIVPTTEHTEDSIDDEGYVMTTNTRRSGRGRKKPEMLSQATYSAPSRITIRGPAASNAVDVKKSVAQELAQLTRSNTRKNKGGSVLPPLRLAKLAIAASATSQDEHIRAGLSAVDVDAEFGKTEALGGNGKREVKWAETLVSYYEGHDSETSLVSDGQPEERLPWERPALLDEDDDKPKPPISAAPPAPADTPSKPRIRRLKAARTASTPARVTCINPAGSLAVAEEHPPSAEEKLRSAPKQKRSRIATPAKGLTGASLLPSDLVAPTTSGARKTAPRKKLASKLPALTSSSTSLGQGKENVIASPPKKKAVSSGLPTAKAFAPKIDFGKARLEPEQLESVPSLMSPAKMGRGMAAVMFGNGFVPVGTSGDEEKKKKKKTGGDVLPPGMRSPAKKRTTKRAAA